MPLSPREAEVLGLICTGLSAKCAARQLGVSFRTIEAQLCSARYKLNARNTTHAAVLFVKHEGKG